MLIGLYVSLNRLCQKRVGIGQTSVKVGCLYLTRSTLSQGRLIGVVGILNLLCELVFDKLLLLRVSHTV